MITVPNVPLPAAIAAAVIPLHDTCADRRVLVVGPAPGVCLPRAAPGDVVYAVNGGLGCVIDRPVNCWQVNGRADRLHLRIEPTPLRLAWLEQGRDRQFDGMIYFMRDMDGHGTYSQLASRGCTANWHLPIMRKWRRSILDAVGVPVEALDASAGLFAACLLLALDARSVVLCGISWSTGYSYLPDHPLTTAPKLRPHFIADRMVLDMLLREYREQISTTALDLITAGVPRVA